MDERKKGALRKHHQHLRTSLLVRNILPVLRPMLTDVEYSQIQDKENNPSKVDELIDVLLTKENRHFDAFCTALKQNGYGHLERDLQKEVEILEGPGDDVNPHATLKVQYPVIDELADEFAMLIVDVEEEMRSLSPKRLQGLKALIKEKLKSKGTASTVPSSADELISTISDYWDCLSFEFARLVVRYLGKEELQTQLKRYEETLQKKAEMLLTQCKTKNITPRVPPGCVSMKITVDIDPYSFSLHRLLKTRDFLVHRIGMDIALFTGWKSGSIFLHFCILEDDKKTAVRQLQEHKLELELELRAMQVVAIEVGDVIVYRDTPIERPSSIAVVNRKIDDLTVTMETGGPIVSKVPAFGSAVLPYQTYCLLDPDTKEPLSGRPLSTKRIEQHWDSHDTPKHPVERTGRVVTMRDTTVDSILQEFRGDILNNVNAKECAPELRRQKVIAEGTETDIERARDARKASGILYDYLRMNCTLEQIVVFSRVLMEVNDGVGRTKNVGYRLHAKIQEGGAVASDQKVSPDESPLNPSTHKAEVNTVQRQGITASPHSKVSFGRCRVPVTCVCLAVLIPFVGVAVCLCPLPFANYWQHRMCPSGITWPWDWGQSDTCTAAEMDTSSIVQERHTQGSDEDADIHSQMSIMDLIQVSELHTDLTKEDLRHLQSVGQNDLVWVEIGVTGVGKSTLGNFLLGKDAFKVGSALKSVTDKAEVDCSAVNDQRMCIVDTPGFGDTRRMVTKNTEAENLASDAAHLIVELSKTMLMAQHGINAFFVVVRADSRELFSTMKLLDLLDILGNYWNHSILVFTHGKEFDKASEERQYAEFEAMLESPSCPDVWQALMEKVSNCYVIVEPEEWKDDKEYRLQKLTEFRKHTSHIAANSGPYNDTLHSLVREYIETAKLELRHEFSDVDSPEAQVAALQVAFKNITSMLYKLIRIKLAGGVDTELLQKMANVKEEQLTEVRKQRDLLYEQLLKEQEEKRRAQAEEEKAREEERKAKERERAMAEERRLALEREEKARKELEEYLKKPTFTERRIETKITRSGFYKWEYVHTAEAVDVATGIRAKAKNYKSKDGAKEHARANLKAILLERGVIRKD